MSLRYQISGSNGRQRIAGWFLAVSYGVGSTVFAIIEARTGVLSARFDFPSEFLYLVSASQFICALLLFVPRAVPWATAVLSVLSVGAVYSHFRIDSPITSLPSIAYTLIQIWYGYRIYRVPEAARRN